MSNKNRRIRIAVYDLQPGETVLPDRPGAVYFLYVKIGSARVAGADAPITSDDGCLVSGNVGVEKGSVAWLYETVCADAPPLDLEIVQLNVIETKFPSPYVIRADRVESKSGAATPRHGHRGPGMRRLVFGQLHAEIGDDIQRIKAGDAWFESGADPVIGTNTGGTNAAFVRILVLPMDLVGGKTSFMAADELEAAKPRSVVYRVFGEVVQ